jgi:mannosylglycerate hydrolase
MRPDASHIKRIAVVSNTHWDREFRRSFEKTRRRLVTMMDTTLEILESDPRFHSFTLDGHSILLDDYLEMRPERKPLVERLLRQGRLIAGPYYTLAEEFSIGQEPLIRNLLWGRKTVEKHGGKVGTVAYTPSSWGQTGQLPQILVDFGLTRMMFYRGISHHESDAEFIWRAPDGTEVLASRFALYARYNWYYQVHRTVTQGRTFDKAYPWGERDETPMRFADGLAGEDVNFEVHAPAVTYDPQKLREAIVGMVDTEGAHFTTPLFLAMHGHDISVAHPLETRIIADSQAALEDRFRISHTSLEEYWDELEGELDKPQLPVLLGERRAYLQKGMWTFLFPGTISARTYLKQRDFDATSRLVRQAEPLATLAYVLGAEYPRRYLDRGWKYLLSNHTHDANGGCAPDAVCADMEYRYRKVQDIADIVSEDALTYVVKSLSPRGEDASALHLTVFNPLASRRDACILLDLELPRRFNARSVDLFDPQGGRVECQPVSSEKSSCFVDSIWDVPTILDSNRLKFYALLRHLPPLGYRSYSLVPSVQESRKPETMITGPDTMENEFVRVRVNPNGSCDLLCKESGKEYRNLNYLSDEGEAGNAWRHLAPLRDRKYCTLGAHADLMVCESGPLVSSICARYDFPVPLDYLDGTTRNPLLVPLPVEVLYRLEKGVAGVGIRLSLENKAKDHWLRANFPTSIAADVSWADTHFDVVSRAIALPDSTDWAERAGGTHPLQTFVALNDENHLFAVIPKGLFEYEVLNDECKTLALTLLRACRIKLAVSEEKQTELSDPGVQCPGSQSFEYFLYTGSGDWQTANLSGRASRQSTPVRAVLSGRGKGHLPAEGWLFSVKPSSVQLSCVKKCEEGEAIVIRAFNPGTAETTAVFEFSRKICQAQMCRMDESRIEELPVGSTCLTVSVGPKKIRTLKVFLEKQ